MVLEHQNEHSSQWAAIESIAGKIGCTAKTRRNPEQVELTTLDWVHRYNHKDCWGRSGMSRQQKLKRRIIGSRRVWPERPGSNQTASKKAGHSAAQPKLTITHMDYQLVIKFWRKSLADEAFLATIESELKEALGDAVELEGYDVSPKEINLFMLASDPRRSFRRAKDVLERLDIEHGISAAFRLVGGARFTSIWPLRTTRKFKLP
jgi:hypothetical protein